MTKLKRVIKKILEGLAKGGLNVVGLGSVLDRNKDGKVDFRDFRWYEFAGAILILSLAVKFEIVNVDVIIQIIEAILG